QKPQVDTAQPFQVVHVQQAALREPCGEVIGERLVGGGVAHTRNSLRREPPRAVLEARRHTTGMRPNEICRAQLCEPPPGGLAAREEGTDEIARGREAEARERPQDLPIADLEMVLVHVCCYDVLRRLIGS